MGVIAPKQKKEGEKSREIWLFALFMLFYLPTEFTKFHSRAFRCTAVRT